MAPGVNFTDAMPMNMGVLAEYYHSGTTNSVTATVYSDAVNNPYCMIGVGLKPR